MPAVGLHLYMAEKFPDLDTGKFVETKHQLPLEVEGAEEGVHTKLERLGISQANAFDRYGVKHDQLERLQGRYGRHPFHQIVLIYDFELFKHKTSKIVIAKGPGRIVRSAAKRLEDKGYEMFPILVDLAKMKAFLNATTAHVTGAHFSEIQEENVTAAAIYGSDVDESDEYRRYADSGSLSAIIVDTVVSGIYDKFMLTRGGTVVVYDRRSEDELLTIALGVMDLIREASAQMTTPENGRTGRGDR